MITNVKPKGDHVFFLHNKMFPEAFLYLWISSLPISRYWLQGIKGSRKQQFFGIQNEGELVEDSIWLVRHVLEGDICAHIAFKEFRECSF